MPSRMGYTNLTWHYLCGSVHNTTSLVECSSDICFCIRIQRLLCCLLRQFNIECSCVNKLAANLVCGKCRKLLHTQSVYAIRDSLENVKNNNGKKKGKDLPNLMGSGGRGGAS